MSTAALTRRDIERLERYRLQTGIAPVVRLSGERHISIGAAAHLIDDLVARERERGIVAHTTAVVDGHGRIVAHTRTKKAPLPSGGPESQARGRFTKKAHTSGSTARAPDLDPDAAYAAQVHARLAELTIAVLTQEVGSVKARSIFTRDQLHERNWELVNEYETFIRKAHARSVPVKETAAAVYKAQPNERLEQTFFKRR